MNNSGLLLGETFLGCSNTKKNGLVLYPRFTALEIVGPFQNLVDMPDLDVFFVAVRRH